MDEEMCQVVYVIVEEKWGIFPREIAQFRALAKDGEEDKIVAKSEKFELEKFNTMGPNENNKKHKAAFDGLVSKLLAQGWEYAGQGDCWFHNSYRRKTHS